MAHLLVTNQMLKFQVLKQFSFVFLMFVAVRLITIVTAVVVFLFSEGNNFLEFGTEAASCILWLFTLLLVCLLFRPSE